MVPKQIPHHSPVILDTFDLITIENLEHLEFRILADSTRQYGHGIILVGEFSILRVGKVVMHKQEELGLATKRHMVLCMIERMRCHP